jgi:hypothetical protein
MVKISILYPDTGRFDKEYYLNTHMPLSIEKQGNALKGISVETGIRGELLDPALLMLLCVICCMIPWNLFTRHLRRMLLC